MTDAIAVDYSILHEGLSLLAARDADYASTLNSVGFGRFDGVHGHRLAETPYEFWTEADKVTAYRIARRYRNTQLQHLDLEDLPAPVDPNGYFERTRDWTPGKHGNVYQHPSDNPSLKGEPFATVTVEGSLLVLGWGGNDPHFGQRVREVKAIPGARFRKASRDWSVPLTLDGIDAVSDLVANSLSWDLPFTVDEETERVMTEVVREFRQTLLESSAKDRDLQISGLTPGLELRPFQRAGVAYAMKHKRTLIGDAPGLGKTIQAIATVVGSGALPALVICPATLKLNWKREIERWVPGAKVQILSGTGKPSKTNISRAKRSSTEVDSEAGWVIVNYDILSHWAETLARSPFRAVVADESHALKSGKAQRTQATAKVIGGTNPEVVLFLTGTPVLNRPIELWSQLDLLGHAGAFGGFWPFAKRYCAGESSNWGMKFDGAQNMEELNLKLRSGGMMVRRTKEEVLTELPPKVWATVPVQMTPGDSKKYLKAEESIANWAAEQRALEADRLGEWRKAGRALGHTGSALDLYVEKERRSFAASEAGRLEASEPLIRFGALKQLAYQTKEAQAFQWIDDFLETGKKLIVFAWHRDAVQAVAKRYGAPMIQGGMKGEEVEDGKTRFQEDPACKVIVCNIMAGGVGHTLTAASDVLFLEYPWNPAAMDQAADRAHRIGQTDSVTAWQMVAVHPDGGETIDGELVAMIAEKREVVSAVTDGFGEEQSAGILASLLEKVEGRVRK